MTNLQQAILVNYKKVFPKDTFSTISKKTNIQQTRVFRLFNGAQMKLSEYEAFSSVLKPQSSHSLMDFREASHQCETELSSENLGELISEMNYLLETVRSVRC